MGAKSQYAIEAELRLKNIKKAQSQLSGVADKLRGIQSAISGQSSMLGTAVVGTLALGAAYTALRVGVGVFHSLTDGAIAYQAQLEQTGISLAAVIGAVQHIPFAQAQREGDRMFKELQSDAVTSVATTQELAGIFTSISGVALGAGKSLEYARHMTLDLVSASTALGVELSVAQRESQMIASGRAGSHVRLWAMLKATGAIRQTSEEFNKMNPAARLELLSAALQRFAPAAAAFGSSWAGLTSTIEDTVDIFKSALFKSAFEGLKFGLARAVKYLLLYKTQIIAVLTNIGKKIGIIVRDLVEIATRLVSGLSQHVRTGVMSVSGMLDRAHQALKSILEHWDEIAARISGVVARVRSLIPGLVRAAKLYAAVSLARTVGGPALGGLARMLELLESILPALGGAAAGAGGGGVIGAIGSLAPLLPWIAAGFAAVAGAAVIVWDHFNELEHLFKTVSSALGLDTLMSDLRAAGAGLWAVLRPVLKVVAILAAPLWAPMAAALAGIVVAARGFLRMLALLGPALTKAGDWMNGAVDNFVSAVITAFDRLIAWISGQHLAAAGGGTSALDMAQKTNGLADVARRQRDVRAAYTWTGSEENIAAAKNGIAVTPDQRAQNNFDFRGSRITVHQEFKKADPDGVAIEMVSDLARQAEQRVQSPFVPWASR